MAELVPIQTKAALQAAVEKWLEHDDLTEAFPVILQLAETRLNRELRIRDMVQVAQGTVKAGTLVLPYAITEQVVFRLTGTTPPRTLEYRPPEDFFDFLGEQAGQPQRYTFVGNTIYLDPVPDPDGDGYPYVFNYYGQITPSLVTSTSNAVLVKWPDLYFYACLLESQPFLQGGERTAEFDVAFARAVRTAHSAESRAKYRGGQQRVRVAGVTPV